jgi:two-component system, chemotaxis family, chemotaxis protein CheY
MTDQTNPKIRPGIVLIVDDSGYARSRLRRFLLEQGFPEVVEAANGDEAIRLFAQHQPCLVLLDQVMRGREGLDTARLMLTSNPQVHIIMLTAVTDRSLLQQALSLGIQRVVQKQDFEALAVAFHELGHE